LPHWEVADRWHFLTIRCQGSLPKEAQQKIREIHDTLKEIDANSPDFAQLQRKYFLACEKYLDAGTGFAPLTREEVNRPCLEALKKIEEEGWLIGECTIMPNHLHCLIYPGDSHQPLRGVIQRFKGRASRELNLILNRKGRFWQQDWFDRWIRDENELRKTIHYIRQNPVKANLVKVWQDYPWRISNFASDDPVR